MNGQASNCEHQFVSTTQKRGATIQGVFGAILFVIGLLVCVANLVAGLLVIALGIGISMIGRNKAVIVCAKCGEPSPHQP